MASTVEPDDGADQSASTSASSARPPSYPNTERFPPQSLTTLVVIADTFLPSQSPPDNYPTLPTSPVFPSTSSPKQTIDDQQNKAKAAAAAAADSADTAANAAALQRFWHHKLDISTSPSYVEAICTAILTKLPPTVRSDLLLLLKLLSTAPGTSLLLCYPCTSGFGSPTWSLEKRIWALQRLRDSPLGKHREAFCGLKRLLCGLAMSYVDEEKLARLNNNKNTDYDGDKDTNTSKDSSGNERRKKVEPWELNPYWEALSYGGPIHRYVSSKKDAELIREGMPYDFQERGAILDINDDNGVNATGGDMDGGGKSTRSSISTRSPSEQEKILTYDVVIIGSGCGGGVAAATLAQAGYSVLVVEKGPYISPYNLSNLESEMFDQLYEQSSLLTTTDGNIMILAGSGLGGGSAINWGCCIETPDVVRKEWADDHGLEHFRPLGGGVQTEFDLSMEAIKERIGVVTSPQKTNMATTTLSPKKNKPGIIHHNGMNDRFITGCEGMGYDWQTTGQNYRDTGTDAVGYTCFGDRYGNKQSGTVTYLADAGKAGAKILPNCTVTKIVKTKDKACGRFKATGVLARVGTQKIRINANRCVICSAGSLNTPCVLLKSGFKNRHIGRHLHLHPVTCAVGLFSEKDELPKKKSGGVGEGMISMLSRTLSRKSIGPMRPPDLDGSVLGWYGAPMTTVCNEFALGPDNDGYGAKLECPSAHTGLMGAGLPWKNPSHFKETLCVARNAVTVIVLQRDRSEGRVRPDKQGRPTISYALEERDKRSMLQSLCGAMSLLCAAGAKCLLSGHNEDEGLNLEVLKDDEKEEAVENYKRSIVGRAMPKYTMSVFSAHQMGTCRIGSSPATSAADEDAELWECDNLYVADASTLPTASGANPMLTTLAMSHMISNRIALRLQYEDDKLDGGEEELFHAIQHVARREERRARASSWVDCVLNIVFSKRGALFVVTVASAILISSMMEGSGTMRMVW